MRIWTVSLLTSFLIQASALAAHPVAQITFRVLDDAGTVVTGATVRMSTFERWVPGPGFGKDIQAHVEGVTDTNGVTTLQMPSLRGSIRYAISVNGDYFANTMRMNVGGRAYYRDMGGRLHFTNHVSGKWQPWNPMVAIELKRVIYPIPMFARRVRLEDDDGIPVQDEPVGYDLQLADWVTPHGKGEKTDLVLVLHRKPEEQALRYWGSQPRSYRVYDVSLALGFSNDGDGLQPYYSTPREGSVFQVPRLAPEGGYVSNLVKRVHNQKDAIPQTDKREGQNYFLRIRTQKDENGIVTNALYGKIAGDIVLAPAGQVHFTYYLNPTPNDRNLEFDPEKNLFKNLSPQEQVREP